jgi:glucokinase
MKINITKTFMGNIQMKNEILALGFDIGGTKIAAALGTGTGRIISSKRIKSENRAPDDVLNEMLVAGNEMLKANGFKSSDLTAIGIGAPGPMDIPKGTISPCNMKKWVDVPVRDYLAEKMGVKAYFDNDANAGVLAEWFFGAGKGCRHLIYLTMSTGIGGGIIVNSHLVQGASFTAGEMGHIVLDPKGPVCNCGLRGCYEAFCGGRAVSQRMQREIAGQPNHPIIEYVGGKIEKLGYPALIEAVKDKNGYALDLWDDICLRNAQAIGIFVNTFNPEMIVLGTIAYHAKELLLEPIKNHLPQFCWKEMIHAMKIQTTALGNEIGEYSGICVALNGLFEEGKWQLPWAK